MELTIDNNIASYFSDQFGKGIVAAGNFGAIFGLFNIISRPSGEQRLAGICAGSPPSILLITYRNPYVGSCL